MFDLSLGELMTKAKDIQNKMKLMQSKLADTNVVGMSNNQEVKIKMNGKYEVTDTIIADGISNASKEALQNFITVAINDALRKIEKIVQESI